MDGYQKGSCMALVQLSEFWCPQNMAAWDAYDVKARHSEGLMDLNAVALRYWVASTPLIWDL